MTSFYLKKETCHFGEQTLIINFIFNLKYTQKINLLRQIRRIKHLYKKKKKPKEAKINVNETKPRSENQGFKSFHQKNLKIYAMD